LTRKALPKLGVIVDIVDYHECAEEPIPFDTSKIEKFVPVEGKDKFVQSLNRLEPPRAGRTDNPPFVARAENRPSMQGTDDLRDRRFDPETKSTAPSSVADQIRMMSNSIPAREASEIPEGLRKDETDSVEMGD
jgi:hypothetical protein